MIVIILYIIGLCVIYVYVHTKKKEWVKWCKEPVDRWSGETRMWKVYLTIAGSWISLAIMVIKEWLDNRFINKIK